MSEIATISNTAIVPLISGEGDIVSSIDVNDKAGAIHAYNAMVSSEPLNEHLGEEIEMVDFIWEQIEFLDEDGVSTSAIRTVIIDSKGNSFHAVSEQLYRAFRRIFALVGMPGTWDGPMSIVVSEQRSRTNATNRYFVVKIV